MKIFAAAVLAAFVLTPAAHGAGPVVVSGALWEKGTVRLSFEENVPRGQSRTMGLATGEVVEMSVDASGGTRIQLRDRRGTALHSSIEVPGPSGGVSFMYTRCRNGTFAYSGPADPRTPGCK